MAPHRSAPRGAQKVEQAAIRTFRRPRPRTLVGTPRGVCVGQSWPTPGAHDRLHESNGSNIRARAWMSCQRACGVLPRLLLNLLSTLRLAELGLEAHVPRSEARGAVVVSAFAVVLGELVRRCCANGGRTLWNRVCAAHYWAVGGWCKCSLKQYISSSSLFKHVCSDFPRRTRSSSVKLRSSVGAPCLSLDALSEEAAIPRGEKSRGGCLSLQSVRADLSVVLFSCICVVYRLERNDKIISGLRACKPALCHAALASHCEPGSVDGTAGHRAGSAASSAGDARVRWRRCCANRWASHGGLLHGCAGRVALHLVC